MATVTYAARSGGVVNSVAGSFTSDNNAQTLTLGFKPNWIKVWNETDVILWEAISTTSATKSWKVVTAGTTTLEVGSPIVINSDGTVTLSATLVGNAKLITFYATA